MQDQSLYKTLPLVQVGCVETKELVGFVIRDKEPVTGGVGFFLNLACCLLKNFSIQTSNFLLSSASSHTFHFLSSAYFRCRLCRILSSVVCLDLLDVTFVCFWTPVFFSTGSVKATWDRALGLAQDETPAQQASNHSTGCRDVVADLFCCCSKTRSCTEGPTGLSSLLEWLTD